MPSNPKITYAYKGDPKWKPLAKHFIDFLGKHFDLSIKQVESSPDFTIGTADKVDLAITPTFRNLIEAKTFSHDHWFKKAPLLIHENFPDYLGTIMYMVNSVQEYFARDLDRYGRFKYESSYQFKFNCVSEDLVSEYFEKIRITLLSPWVPKKRQVKSKVFLSHDIDKVKAATRTEMLHAFRSKNLSKIKSTAQKALQNSLGWNDFEGLARFHQRRGYSTTFFWLTEFGDGEDGIYNADYKFSNDISKSTLEQIEAHKCFNALHKSSSPNSLETDFQRLSHHIPANRNHYLKIQLPQFYRELEASPIQFDSSLGLSQAMGFRNSYSKAFVPFDFDKQRPFHFVEYPLQIMDVSLCIHMYNSPNEAWPSIEQFLEKHQYNAELSILFHNQYLTKGVYADWLKLYHLIMDKLQELGIESTDPLKVIKGLL